LADKFIYWREFRLPGGNHGISSGNQIPDHNPSFLAAKETELILTSSQALEYGRIGL
jgi:hypothetical protein